MTLKLVTDKVDADGDGATLHSLGDVADVLGVAPERVRAWMTAGLIQPVRIEQGTPLFDFRQVAAARTICDLVRSGLSLGRVRKQLERLRNLAAEHPRDILPLVERDGRLLVRLNDDELAASDGQLHFDYDPQPSDPPMRLTVTPATAGEWHEKGIEEEQRGCFAAAAECYRMALQAGGPDAQVCFDLAHVLALSGDRPAAIERYMQATELDRDFADAWNNLGVLLAEAGRPLAACTAFRRALAAEPFNLRAHYNLADTLEELGRADEAREHWLTYLQGDPRSEYASYARTKLG